MTPEISIVVPVYKSEKLLPRLVAEVDLAMQKEGYVGRYELLLVNDSSPDGSWEVIKEFSSKYDYVRGLSLRKNFGQHSAIMAGLNSARGEYVVLMDDDLQHPPASIGDLVRKLQAGYDVCYTNYRGRKHAAWKIIGSRFNNWVATILLDKPSDLYLSSFKAMRREVVQEVIKYDGPYAYLDGLILDVTRSITSVDVEHRPRPDGEGNYNLRRSISLWLRMATSFSVFPLRMMTYLGFLVTFASILIIAYIIVLKILHPETPAGWSSLAASVFFVGGVQTFCIGVVGEYLGRSYLKINRKPQFVVREKTWSESEPE